MGKTPERLDDFIWFHRVYDITYDLYGLKSNKTIFESSISSLKRLSVAVSKDDAAHIFLEKRGYNNRVYINNYEQMMTLLKRGRVDMIASNNIGIYQAFKKNPEDSKDIVRLDASISPVVESYFAMNKNSDPELVKRVQQGFQKIIKNGLYNNIMSRLPNFLTKKSVLDK